MFNGDRKKTAEFCLDQFERFLKGIRHWDCDAVSYAEIHAAALFLCEDVEFEQILKNHWSRARPYRTLGSDASPIDFAVNVAPDFVSGFFESLIDYMEQFNGKICGDQPSKPTNSSSSQT
jgi:hypothetical protein